MLKKIINTCLLVCLGLCFSFSVKTSDFKSQQMAFSRVKTAYAGKWAGLKSLLRSKGLEETASVFISGYLKKNPSWRSGSWTRNTAPGNC